MKKIAIVILNWNGKKFLEQFLPSVISNSSVEGTFIVIADNGSSDGSVEFVEQNFVELKLIKLDKNYGFTGGYNRALALIEADYFVLLNSDVEVTAGWIEPMVELFEKDPKVAAIMPKMLDYSRHDYFEYAGACGGFIDRFGYPFCRGRILSEVEKDHGQYDDVREVFWATGACMFVRADLFRKAGGLDEGFFAHMEEIDMCWRLKNMGYKIMVHPGVKVYHVGGGTLPNNNPRKLYYNYRNNLLLLYKNLPGFKLLIILCIRMILDGLSACAYLVTGKWQFFKAVLKAHWHFYKLLRAYLPARKYSRRLATVYRTDQVLRGSIVFAFFVRKKRKFSEIQLLNSLTSKKPKD